MTNNSASNAEFLGRGWRFPPTFDKERQDIVLVEAGIDIQQSLEIILSTLPGERVLTPDFGANLDRLLFEPLDASLISLMQDIIETALIRHEPRIGVNNVLIEEDGSFEGRVLIEVDYTVRSTNTRFNFVYPFYIQEGTDIRVLEGSAQRIENRIVEER
jgi:phage baseplate assembly protein W